MALIERVTTLLRANLNELIDRAEEPEAMLRQVILDMRNQLMQVKTQVAIAVADQHLLERKLAEITEKAAAWNGRAEMAMEKGDEALARAALERVVGCEEMMHGYTQQIADQRDEAENLKELLRRLERRLSEAEMRCEMLMAQHRRARAVERGQAAQGGVQESGPAETMERMRSRIERSEARGRALGELQEENVDERFAQMERERLVEGRLALLKAKQSRSA